ncbi:MAG: hypothetical protein B7X83_03335 [Polynucleobacter sp. 17-46-58]|nr:MAG: hypothetical protein B7Y55_11815 [Polynucleobacter sp. 35-46-207]OYZ38502.1 MAG: hypothetical protein B7Y22_01810 [Polynucleobacter sp. 16-46-70]OZA41025.1 MAG: hypothetical protein B7X83_03335 [Polynucleobacter sp. 17-46-58]OZB35078.1 MAG: hypothetical protein B7X60_14555 [Polynucleobacter sp. 39-45-136]
MLFKLKANNLLNECMNVRPILSITLFAITAIVLGGCQASSTSPDGVSCDFRQEKPLWEMPLVCQGR